MIKTSLARASRWGREEALLFLDVQDFKRINQTFSDEVGNALLVDIAERLTNDLRESDFIARYGGNSFAIHLGKKNEENIKTRCKLLAQKMHALMVEPFKIEDMDVDVSMNIVMSLYPEAGQDFDAIMENTEVAMHFLKVSKERNCCFAKNLHESLHEGTDVIGLASRKVA